MKLIKTKKWIEENFREDSRPDKRSIHKLIDSGELPGRRIGKIYYVETQENPLIDKIMAI